MLTPGWYQFFGWFFFLTTLPTLVLHIIVALAIVKIPTFNQRIALRLMFSMSIADGGQTLMHLISGIVTIFNCEIPYFPNIIFGILIETFWEAMMFLQLGLGINRLYIVTRNTITREKDFKYFDWPVLLGWIGSLIYTALYWTGGRHLHYEIEFLGWPTIYTNETQTELVTYLYNGEMLFMVIGFILCVLVVIVMAYRRRMTGAGNRVANSSMELRMLAQISVIYVLAISNILLWNIFANAEVEYQALLNFEWILICGLPPYLNILISGEIRRSVVSLLMPAYSKIFNFAPSSISRILPKPISVVTFAPTTQITRVPTRSVVSTVNTLRALTLTRQPFSANNVKILQVDNIRILQVNSALKMYEEYSRNFPSQTLPNTNKSKKKRVVFVSPSPTIISSRDNTEIKCAP